jgi:Tol biopolymer transport system component
LAYQSGAADSQEQLTWFNPSGKPIGTVGDPGEIGSVEFSPDRKSVAVTRHGQNDDIWIYDVARGLAKRLTFSPADERAPVWSPDGQYITYMSNAQAQFDLYRKAADGTGSEQLLYADRTLKVPTRWSPYGKFLLYTTPWNPLADILVLPLGRKAAVGSPTKLFPRSGMPFNRGLAKFAPDGRWVAYQSNESGRFEVYLASFRGAGSKQQVSAGGGGMHRWRADGKEIFYIAPSGTLMAAEISIKGTNVEVGAVRSLGIPVPLHTFYPYDVSADGQRFVVAVPQEQGSAAPLTLVRRI